MKLLYRIFAAAASILALSSCVEDAIEPMTGKYEKPVVYEMNTLVSQSVDKGDKTRTFNIELSGSGASISMKFVGDKYFLADGSYTPATADAAKKNTYIVGNGGTAFNNIPVVSGTIKVAQGEGTYTFGGILWLADESVIEIKSTVELVYEADPEPVKLNTVISATSNVANGTNSVTLNLATDGVTATYDPATWSNVYSGTGNYLAIDLYSADGFLHEGTYTASAAGGVINEGEFGIGWDPGDLWGIGMVFENWGTCWWDVNNGVVTINQKVTEGTVTVSKKGSKWVIELISGEGKSMLWTKFEGAVDALTDNGSQSGKDYDEYIQLLLVQPNAEYDANYQPTGKFSSLTLKFGTDGISSEQVPNDWGGNDTVFKGTGDVLNIDFYTTDGTLAAGTYTACATAGTVLEDEFGIGYDVEMWGQQMVWGSCVTPYANDAPGEILKITDGTITVECNGDTYTITLESSTVNAQYIGTLTL